MLHVPRPDWLVNPWAISVRGLAHLNIDRTGRIRMAADAKLGWSRLEDLRARDVCGIFDIRSHELAAEIRARAAGRIPGIRVASVDALKANGSGGNGHTSNGGGQAAQFAETLKAMDPTELAAAFKAAGSEVVSALVRAL